LKHIDIIDFLLRLVRAEIEFGDVLPLNDIARVGKDMLYFSNEDDGFK